MNPIILVIIVFIGLSTTDTSNLNKVKNIKIICDYYETTNVSDGSLQLDDSWLHNGLHYGKGFYANFDYILDPIGVKVPVPDHVRGCTCLMKPCIRSCCRLHEKSDALASCTNKMIDGELMWNVGIGNSTEKVDVTTAFDWVVRRPQCIEKVFLEPEEFEDDIWYLMKDGSIYVDDDKSLLEEGQYCLSVLDLENDTKPSLTVLKCNIPLETGHRYRTLGIGMLLSVPFLLATFIVYAVIPELRNVHGKSLMSYVAGLTVGYGFLGSIQLIGIRAECQNGSATCFNPVACVISGYIIYFSFMMSFFWLNTMCFDIFWTFRAVKGNTSARKKFNYYSLYSWGLSFLMTLILLLAHSFGSDAINPKIGKNSCFLSNEWLVEFLYLYLVLLVLVCMNITFFAITAFKIKKAQAETSAVVEAGNSSKHSKQNYDKYRFMLYLRLFIIMGDIPLLLTVTWSMELLSWVIDPDNPAFLISDLVNCLQGVLIFILVVCNNKVRKLVVKKYYKLRGIPDPESLANTDITRQSRTSSAYIKHVSLDQRTALLIREQDNNLDNKNKIT